MITSQELYEAGFASSERKYGDLIYKEFSKFLPNGIEIQVTHEINGDIVEVCYVEIGIYRSYKKIKADTIYHINNLIKIL